MDLPANLCYTIALDQPGKDIHARMARLLVTSLLLTGWHGRIVVFRNSSKPVLAESHPLVQEIEVAARTDGPWHETVSWKYRLRDQLDITGISKVLFLDCDCLALRSLNQLMYGNWDIYTAPEPGSIIETPFNGYLSDDEMTGLKARRGLNSGTYGVRAAHFVSVMAGWEAIALSEPKRPSKCRNQHSWNRFILDTQLRHRSFAPGEVQFPFLHRAAYVDFSRAALVHAADRSPEEKFAFLFGLWMSIFGQHHFEAATAGPALVGEN